MKAVQRLFSYLFLLCAILCLILALDSFQAPVLVSREEPIALHANQAGDDLRDILVAGIMQAKKSILLIIYSMGDPQITQSLRNKSVEGVDVQVIYDAKATPYVARKLGPLVKKHKRHHKGLMHQKILVVDDAWVWIGSANMTGASLHAHGNLLCSFFCPELAKMIAEKAKRMMQPLKESSPLLHQTFTLNHQPLEMWFLPDDKSGVSRIQQLIRSAKKTVRVAMFTWTRYDLAQEVIMAKKRGVETSVVIDQHSAQGASAKVVNLLKKEGVPVRLNRGSELHHHKFLYIDGTTLVNGSANWTLAAFTKNDDCFMVLQNLTVEQRNYLDKLWSIIEADSI